jgi:dimethylamine monooxygenase subunit C
MTDSSSGIRSKPQYGKLQHDPLTRWNLLIGEGDGLIGLINLFNESPNIKPSVTTLLYCGSDVEKAYAQAYFRPDRCKKISRYEDRDGLLKELPLVLEECFMGTRIYVSGSEAFMWKVRKVASTFGMHKSEICMELFGSLARRVYCPHCETTNEGVTSDIAECTGCGLSLINIDHFSREMGAYLGFRVDAETPGVIPERQELYQ